MSKPTPFEIRRDAGHIRQDRGIALPSTGPAVSPGGPASGNSVRSRESREEQVDALQALIDADLPVVSITSALPSPATVGTDTAVDVIWQGSEPGNYSVLVGDTEVDSGTYSPIDDGSVTTTIAIGDLALGVNIITVNLTNAENEVGTDPISVTKADAP